MTSPVTTLRELEIGKTATVVSVGGEGALRQHFLDMGLIPETDVTMVKYAPMGDPVEVRLHGYALTLRLADAEKIVIENVRTAEEVKRKNKRISTIPDSVKGVSITSRLMRTLFPKEKH